MSYAEKRNGLPTGTWIAERVLQGRVRRKRFKNKEDASKWEKTVDETGALPPEEKPYIPYPLSFIAREAKTSRAAWSNTKYPDIGARVETILDHFGRGASIDSITNEAIADFVDALKKRKARNGGPLTGKSINRHLACLSALLSFSRSKGWSYHAPQIPWQPEPPLPVRVISPEDETRFLKALNSVDRTIAKVFLIGGLHSSELFNLTLERIQTDGDEFGFLTVGSKNSRQVALPIELAKELRDLIAAKQLPAPNDFYLAVKRAFASIGLDRGLSIKTLRQTALVRAGRQHSIQVTQSFAGHTSPKTTQRYLILPSTQEVELALSADATSINLSQENQVKEQNI